MHALVRTWLHLDAASCVLQAGVLYCANKYDAVKTFLRLCEMEGDCDGDGYSTSTDPDSADFRGRRGAP